MLTFAPQSSSVKLWKEVVDNHVDKDFSSALAAIQSESPKSRACRDKRRNDADKSAKRLDRNQQEAPCTSFIIELATCQRSHSRRSRVSNVPRKNLVATLNVQQCQHKV